MFRLGRLFCVVWIMFAAALARADAPQPTSLFDPARHMHVSEVRPGMTGYGLSVFSGTKIERFDVEVVSVLKNFNPKDDVVLIKCHGANLEHTGAIAGMSGSPIFLKDDEGRERMIGAFAYGWPLVKDPIAGVQPIEYMLKLPVTPTTHPVAAPVTAPVQPDTIDQAKWSLWQEIPIPGWPQPRDNSLLSSEDQSREAPADGELRPLATPLMTSGFSAPVLNAYAPYLRRFGLTALQAGGVSGGDTTQQSTIAPGSVLAAPLLTGDADMTAVGTCTEVIGDRVFGFGHPFNNEGPIDLPFGGGQINAIIAQLQQSFKLGTIGGLAGTLTADQSVGVAGLLGKSPATVPIDIRIVYTDGSQDLTYHFQAVRHPRFTPLLTAMAVSAALTGQRELPPYHTLDYDMKVSFANGRTIKDTNVLADDNPASLLMAFAGPMMAASMNTFEDVLPDRVTATVHVTPQSRAAEILSVDVPKLKYKPGETLQAYVQYRPFHGAEATLPITLALPRDLPDGTYQFVVGGWMRYLTDEQAARPFRFDAENIRDVFDVLADFASIRHDAVYARLLRQADGVAVGRTAMPKLPSSRRQVMLDAGRSNTSAYISSTVKIVPTTWVMDGAAQFEITIESQGHTEPQQRPQLPTAIPQPVPGEKKPTRVEPGRQPGGAPGEPPR